MKKYLIATTFVCLIYLLFFLNNEVVGNKIIIGQSTALTGSAQNLGMEFTKGANAYFKFINDLGGVNGRKIELITIDDSYEPEYAKQNTINLIKNRNVFAMFGEVGTPTSEAVLPIINEYNIPFLTPLSGADSLRNDNKLIVNLRNSYKDETKALVQFLITEYKIKKIAVFYQDDNYGKSGYEGVKSALKEYNLEIVEEGRYRRNTLSFHNALLNINNANPEAVIIVGTQKASAFFIKEAKKLGLKDAKFCNVSFAGGDTFIKELNGDTNNVIFSQIVPLPWDNSHEGIKEYQEIYSKYNENPNFSFISLEGFLSAKLVVKALQKAGVDLTRKNFLEAFNKLDKNALAGFEINFSKNNNEALEQIYILDFYNSKYRVLKEVKIK